MQGNNFWTQRRVRVAWSFLVGLVCFVIYCIVGIARHRHFDSGGYDLGIFEQAIRNYAHFHVPEVPLKGPGFNVLGDHFHPILILLAPIYRVFPTAVTLIVSQAGLVALGIGVLTYAGIKHLSLVAGVCIGFACGLSWGVQNMVLFDFHETAFAVPIIAFALAAYLDAKWRTAAIWMALLILVKEDMPLVMFMFAVVLWLKGQRKLAYGLATFSVATFVLIIQVIIPAFSPSHTYTYWKNTVEGADNSLVHRAMHMFEGDGKVLKLWSLSWVTVFTAFLSPLVLLIMPTVFFQLVSPTPAYWGVEFHYYATMMIVLFFAAIDALRKIGNWSGVWPKVVRVLPPVMLLFALLAVPNSFFGSLIDNQQYFRSSARIRAANDAIALIPNGAVVSAENRTAAHLTTRATVYLLKGDFGDSNANPLFPEWIIADTKTDSFPLTPRTAKEAIATAKACGYLQRFSREGYVVLQRGPDARPPGQCLPTPQ